MAIKHTGWSEEILVYRNFALKICFHSYKFFYVTYFYRIYNRCLKTHRKSTKIFCLYDPSFGKATESLGPALSQWQLSVCLFPTHFHPPALSPHTIHYQITSKSTGTVLLMLCFLTDLKLSKHL